MRCTLSAILCVVVLGAAFVSPTARGDEAADIKNLREEVLKLQEQVHRLQLGALANQLGYVRHVLLTSKLTDDEKKKDADTLDRYVTTLRKGTPLTDNELTSIGDMVHAINKAGFAAKDLNDCLQKCDDAYNAQLANCNNLQDPFDRAYCQNQALEAWQSCQNNCQNNPNRDVNH